MVNVTVLDGRPRFPLASIAITRAKYVPWEQPSQKSPIVIPRLVSVMLSNLIEPAGNVESFDARSSYLAARSAAVQKSSKFSNGWKVSPYGGRLRTGVPGWSAVAPVTVKVLGAENAL